jgi:hypothetical protein
VFLPSSFPFLVHVSQVSRKLTVSDRDHLFIKPLLIAGLITRTEQDRAALWVVTEAEKGGAGAVIGAAADSAGVVGSSTGYSVGTIGGSSGGLYDPTDR